jgi:serine/threonine-protein kinase HipA
MSAVPPTTGIGVFVQNERVGALARTPSGGGVFEYAEDYFSAHQNFEGGVASTLPFRQKRFETQGVNLHPFFAGLLPEGRFLSALESRLKTSRDDLLSLLLASGSDAIGDAEFAPEGKKPVEPSPLIHFDSQSNIVFSKLFEQSLQKASDGLPGVQDKISASMISFPIRANARAEAYILKLNPVDRHQLVVNEFFFMHMANECGLKVAKSRVIYDSLGAPALLVTRFDRVWNKQTKSFMRVHQEDACQMLNRYPADKYRISCSEIAQALEICAAPVFERLRFLQLLAFSYLIGNGDLHGKNVSIWSGPSNGFQLSPAYDLLSTLPYGDSKMALKLDGRDDNWKRKHLIQFGERFGVRGKATELMLDQLIKKAAPFVARFAEIALDSKKTAQLQKVFKKRLKDLDV